MESVSLTNKPKMYPNATYIVLRFFSVKLIQHDVQTQNCELQWIFAHWPRIASERMIRCGFVL